MPAKLQNNNYGKSNVRVLKVKRDTPTHEIKELDVNVQFDGDFEKVHTEGDNRKVLPTDTIKNTVYVLAKQNSVNSIEEFATYVSKYFLDNNQQVSNVKVEIEESSWKRIKVRDESTGDLKYHDHSFLSAGNEKRSVSVRMNRNSQKIISGLKDLLVLKTTDSGFENYIKDKYTTLKETSDRIFATVIKAEWEFVNYKVDYNSVYSNVRHIILETFAKHKSLSVQHTIYEIGKNVIEQCKDISKIFLSMPNKHCLLFNLEQFGIENKNEIFVPTDEPYGLIEASISRE